jgi:hypothetical protein
MPVWMLVAVGQALPAQAAHLTRRRALLAGSAKLDQESIRESMRQKLKVPQPRRYERTRLAT